MAPIIRSYAVMGATGRIGSVVAEGPLLALSLAAALAFVLGCARPAEKLSLIHISEPTRPY